MARHHAVGRFGFLRKRWPIVLALISMVAISMLLLLPLSSPFDSCDRRCEVNKKPKVVPLVMSPGGGDLGVSKNHLGFMKSKLVLLVSHEMSLSGGPLLLMELAYMLRWVGAKVCWITTQTSSETDVVYNLEHKLLSHGVQIISAKDQEAVAIALKADIVVLNTAVAGKWLHTLKDNIPHVIPKVLWWIHEMRGHYFKLEYVKYLPMVAGAMIDSHVTAAYWKNRTQESLRITMPPTYVVHLGNSKDLMEVAESDVARRVLREHVRDLLGVRQEDLLFGIINSMLSSFATFNSSTKRSRNTTNDNGFSMVG